MSAAMPPPPTPLPPLRWDLFCRVIDNYGDIGVCWRLARDLSARGHTLRLWVDDPRALAWMAPDRPSGIELLHWRDATPLPAPGDVVVEAFGCDPPAGFIAAMASQTRPPVWINLEYLSAEPYVERSHRLMSPQLSGPGRGLVKWFFYPGFTPATGGLLREPGLIDALDALDTDTCLRRLGVQRLPGERCVSVFCYPGAPLAELPTHLADAPTLLLATPGAATDGLSRLTLPAGVRLQALPWLPQADYDRLLRSCDLNLVRGEDSFVRAQWAGRPMLWHIYPQDDGAHEAKLETFLARWQSGAEPGLAAAVRRAMRAWCGLDTHGPARLAPLPPLPAWQAQAQRWRQHLQAQPDLVSQLLAFVTEKR